MKGHIITFNSENQTGIIKGADGKRYTFNSKSVFYDGKIEMNDEADFEIDGDIAFDICITSQMTGVNVNLQDLTSKFHSKILLEKIKDTDIKNIPGVISSLIILIALAFKLFNVEVMGMQVPVYPDTDVNNNLVITLIVFFSIAATFLFGLGLNKKYLKIINLSLVATFIALFLNAIISVNNINEAGNSASDIFGSFGMEAQEIPKFVKVQPAIGYYTGLVGVLVNLYLTFIHKNYNSRN